ncbi:helix-turn-helix domain-containing protein [Burkholderia cenocepacia]|uniref:helix-turn-helix domain-containing protein n=1 Tax=Burkholderia cenocepacia TaxID=95486 RepID=UPI0028602C87|nr:LysR family transcriptional regulator [Burkholderia cenocepacia]
MDTVQTLKIFVRVASLDNFTAAADQLGLTKAFVSRSIAQLENTLGPFAASDVSASCSFRSGRALPRSL